MSVPAVKFGAVFIAPQTATNVLNSVVNDPQFRKQNPVGPNIVGRQFLASLTGVQRICDGGAVYFKPADLENGLTEPSTQDYLRNRGVQSGDLLVVTGQSIGDIQAGETPEHFVLKQMMFKPTDVRLLSQKQVETALDDIMPAYKSVPGSVPDSLMQNLNYYHDVAHYAEAVDVKPALQLQATAQTMAAYANAMFTNAQRAQVQMQQNGTIVPNNAAQNPFNKGTGLPIGIMQNAAARPQRQLDKVG